MADFLKPGDRFLEYRLLSVIGEGGMGVVFKAIEDRSDDVVAIKCLLSRHANRKDFAARFEEECRLYPKLKHDNIVRMRRTGVAYVEAPPAPPQPIPFIVMDLLEGRTLRGLLDRFHRLDYLNTIHILVQVVEAMRLAHKKGVLHRDLKPENMIVGSLGEEKGHLWILDFGIGKDVRRGLDTDDMSDVGTARYMAPEQVRNILTAGKKGQRAKVGKRADIYAFGVIGYEVVTGRHYFVNDKDPPTFEETLLGHLTAEPTPIHMLVPDAPWQMEDLLWPILQRCLAKDPDARYETFDEVLDDLQQLVRGSVPAGHPLAQRAVAEVAKQKRREAFASLDDRPRGDVPMDPSGREALPPEPPSASPGEQAPAEAAADDRRPVPEAMALATTLPAPSDAQPEMAADTQPDTAADAQPDTAADTLQTVPVRERLTGLLVDYVAGAPPLPFASPHAAAPFLAPGPLLEPPPKRGVGFTMKLQAPDLSVVNGAPQRGVGFTTKLQAPQLPNADGGAARRAEPARVPWAPKFGLPPVPLGAHAAFALPPPPLPSAPIAAGAAAPPEPAPATASAVPPPNLSVRSAQRLPAPALPDATTPRRPTPPTPTSMSTPSQPPRASRRHLLLAPLLLGLTIVLAGVDVFLVVRAQRTTAQPVPAQPSATVATAPEASTDPPAPAPAASAPTQVAAERPAPSAVASAPATQAPLAPKAPKPTRRPPPRTDFWFK